MFDPTLRALLHRIVACMYATPALISLFLTVFLAWLVPALRGRNFYPDWAEDLLHKPFCRACDAMSGKAGAR